MDLFKGDIYIIKIGNCYLVAEHDIFNNFDDLKLVETAESATEIKDLDVARGLVDRIGGTIYKKSIELERVEFK